MVPSGHPAPVGGAQSVSPAIIRSNSGVSLPSQSPFSSLISPRTQFNNNPNSMNILGNIPNVSSLLQNREIGSSAEPDPLSIQSPNPNQGVLENIQSHQQQFALRNMVPVKIEPQVGLGVVKPDPQAQSMPVKVESNPHSDSSLFLQQQQQMINMPRQNSNPTAQMNLLQHQHRLMQMKQQQQIIKSLPQQRINQQQQFQQQAISLRPQVKSSAYEPGMCARRLTLYMYHQKHRPSDNNIEFWRKFVAEYFAPHARKRWCVSLYGSGRQTTGVFPQDVWYCEICNRRPGRGFETTVEVLPRLYKIKYDSGTQEELLYVDMPREYQNSAGQIVLDYAKAIQESVFDQLRVVREGQLRIIFSTDLKICSWEFCARRHEELIPRRLIIPQVSQLGQVAQKYQASTQNGASNLSTQEVQSSCNLFVASTRQLAKALEVPLVNDLGYTKRYVRCLQIAEVVNCMKDLIDYTRETQMGPMESLRNFPRRTAATANVPASTSIDQAPASIKGASTAGMASINHPQNSSVSSLSAGNIPASLQNTMMGGGGSAGSSNSLPPSQQNPSNNSGQLAPPPSSSSSAHLSSSVAAAQFVGESEPGNGTQSSVQQFLQEMMMSSHPQLGVMPGLGGGFGPSLAAGGIRAAMMMGNNSLSFNGRNGMDPAAVSHQQQELGNRLLSGSFNNHQFGWKTSP